MFNFGKKDLEYLTGTDIVVEKKPMKLKIKLTDSKAVMPTKGSSGAAGFDLTAISEKFIQELSGPIWEYETGVAFEIPKGYVGLLFPRSSVYKTSLNLSNAVGVIDEDFRGPVKFKFRLIPPGKKYNVGDRIGQIVFVPILEVELEKVDELSETERGTNGFGSSGQ